MKFIKREERRRIVGFNDYLLMVATIPVFAVFYPLLVFDISPVDDFTNFILSFLISIIHIAVYWFTERYIVIVIRKRHPEYEAYRKRIIIQSVAVVCSTFVLCFISEIPQFCFGASPEVFDVPFFNKFMGSLIITTIIITIYEGIYAFQLFKQSLIKNEDLQRQNTQAQLESLRNQVNPHFLFNSLNTLISVIPEDSKTAVKFAENLSSVYRYILEIRDQELIPLADELKCIDAYRYLLSIRFGNHIQFEFKNLENLSQKYIVPLSVQMLMENAVKHNVVSQSRPLTISISLEENQLKVCNKIQPKIQNISSTGVGLKNIEKRYQLLANREITVEKTDELFCVYLPILKMKEVK